jgi:hypothetical protein
MQHVPQQAWIDFVRGVSSRDVQTGHSKDANDRAELEAHLASGCKDCNATAGFWKKVQRIAARESGYCPPADVVRMAKAEFRASYLENAAEATEARLVFDTFSRPVMAGVRSAAAAARQMVYEAEGLTVDLHVDRHPQSNMMQLVGQVLDAQTLQAVSGNSAVILRTEKDVLLAKGRTNYFGEFQVEFEAQDEVRLSIWVAGNKWICIALASLQQKAGFDRSGRRADAGNL